MRTRMRRFIPLQVFAFALILLAGSNPTAFGSSKVAGNFIDAITTGTRKADVPVPRHTPASDLPSSSTYRATHSTNFNDAVTAPLPVVKPIQVNSLSFSTSTLKPRVQAVEDYLGGQGKVIRNPAGDAILMKDDKKIRFDIKNPHGDAPHFHVEQQSPSGRWKDAGNQHRYYFKK